MRVDFAYSLRLLLALWPLLFFGGCLTGCQNPLDKVLYDVSKGGLMTASSIIAQSTPKSAGAKIDVRLRDPKIAVAYVTEHRIEYEIEGLDLTGSGKASLVGDGGPLTPEERARVFEINDPEAVRVFRGLRAATQPMPWPMQTVAPAQPVNP